MKFEERVITRPPCEAEIESVRGRKDWHLCGKPATVFSDKRLSNSDYRLYYCSRHESKASQADTPSVSVTRVGRVIKERA